MALTPLHAPFVDYDLSDGNRVTAAWLNAMQNRWLEAISVRDSAFGATGNGVTDDLAAFNLAATYAIANQRAIFIPPCEPGKYYKLSGPWVLTDADSIVVFGVGTPSLLVIANAAGGNCITLNSTTHATIRDIGIYGTSGSGHGIELTNGSHLNKFSGIWIGWCDGDGIKVTSGQSNTFTDCDIDQNSGYRPATLISPLTDGSIDHGVHIPYEALGNTNNQSFSNCRINGAGASYSLKVGNTTGSVDSFSWVGGLIQGSSVYQEVYLRTRDAHILNCHIEPPVGATANYVVTFDRCADTSIENGVVAGDVNFSGMNSQTGLVKVRGAGINASNATGSLGCFVRDGQYKNIATGPTGGSIIDPLGVLAVTNMVNASNDYFITGWNLSERAVPYFVTNLEDWLGGASPILPAGWFQVGGTLSRVTSPVKAGTYAAQLVYSANNTQYIGISLGPIEQIRGKTVGVVAWVYNATTNGLASVSAVSAGGANAGTRFEGSWSSGAFERMVVSFKVPPDATNFQIRLTGLIGTVIWDEVGIWVEGFAPSRQTALTNGGTPDVTVGGRMVPLVTTGGTTTITDFPEAHPGVPFTLLGRHTVTITNNLTKLVTKSGADISMTNGGVAEFVRGRDTGYIYEI